MATSFADLIDAEWIRAGAEKPEMLSKSSDGTGRPVASNGGARRGGRGTDDRIVIDVGGTKFVTTPQTLTSNSTYFHTLIHDSDWTDDGQGIFLDRDPVAFGKLLEYMRNGVIKVEDIDIHVLILAEILGLTRLLLAVKVRWYCNIGKGTCAALSDEAIAATFDEVHGGIATAISRGLFPFFLKQDDIDSEKDVALMTVNMDDMEEVTVKEIVNDIPGPVIRCGGIFGALNGLHANGFTSPGQQLHRDYATSADSSQVLISFFRRRHSSMRIGDSTAILIPTHDETDKRKQFAVYMKNLAVKNQMWVVAPFEFTDEVIDISNPYADATIHHDELGDKYENLHVWLSIHRFTTPETWILGNELSEIEYKQFLEQHGLICDIQIYSRPLSLVQPGGGGGTVVRTSTSREIQTYSSPTGSLPALPCPEVSEFLLQLDPIATVI